MELDKSTKQAWAKFLNSTAGKEGLEYLKYFTPAIQVDPQQHVMMFSSGRSQGYKEAFQRIEELKDLRKTEPVDLENP